MDWENERYIRLYTRDTVTWTLWPWESKALFCLLLRKVDRAGVMDLGGHEPHLAIAAIVGMPPQVVLNHVENLTGSGAVEITSGVLVIPAFMEAQEARASAALRQKESRARRRARARAGVEKPEDGARDPREDVVYFIQPSLGGPVKIGRAKNLSSRLSSLRSSSPDPLTLIATLQDGDREAEIHDLFASDRVHGEWFNPSQKMLDWLQSVTKCDNPLRIVMPGQPLAEPSVAEPSQIKPTPASKSPKSKEHPDVDAALQILDEGRAKVLANPKPSRDAKARILITKVLAAYTLEDVRHVVRCWLDDCAKADANWEPHKYFVAKTVFGMSGFGARVDRPDPDEKPKTQTSAELPDWANEAAP